MSVPNSFMSWDDFDVDPYTSVIDPSMSTPGSSTSALDMSSSDNFFYIQKPFSLSFKTNIEQKKHVFNRSYHQENVNIFIILSFTFFKKSSFKANLELNLL